MARPYVIVVRNGPTWKLDALEFLAEVLSRKDDGEIWTFYHKGPFDETPVGSFRIRRYRVLEGWRALGKALHIGRLVLRGLFLRWVKGRRLLVITYDPLVNGTIGIVLKYLAGARFICEVNGVYDDPNNLVDSPNPDAVGKKLKRMKAVSSWVLSHADHIKLLFPTQVDGYTRIPSSIPRRAFANLVDSRRFEYSETEHEPILLFIGYPFLRKGCDVLLKAFSRTVPDFPGWKLVLIGFRNEARAKRMGLPVTSVEFLEPRPQDEISRWLERSSALILPSRSEAMGRVLVEAALKGRARLGSRTGGIPHYIEDGVDGLLFLPDDVDDLEATLRRFFSDPEAPARLGAGARARAETEFSEEAYLEAYSEIISRVWN